MASDSLPFGVLRRPHGTEGEILLQPYGGARARPADWRLPPRLCVTGPDGETRHDRGRRCGACPKATWSASKGLATARRPRSCRARQVRLPRQSLAKLGAEEFFVEEIIGCEVFRDGGTRLGKVVGTYWNGAQDIMVVTAEDGAEHLLPVLAEYVLGFRSGESLAGGGPP